MKLLTKLFLPMTLLCTLSLPSNADDMAGDKKEMPKMTKEQREKMATLHDKMAACLRSEKAMPDCRDEMKKSCSEMGEEGCPMMHHQMGMKKGMKHKRNKDKTENSETK